MHEDGTARKIEQVCMSHYQGYTLKLYSFASVNFNKITVLVKQSLYCPTLHNGIRFLRATTKLRASGIIEFVICCNMGNIL